MNSENRVPGRVAVRELLSAKVELSALAMMWALPLDCAGRNSRCTPRSMPSATPPAKANRS